MLNSSVGLLIIAAGILLVLIGLFLIRKQRQEKSRAEEQMATLLKSQVKEAKLVSHELTNLMRKATSLSGGIVDQIQSNVAEAKRIAEQLETAKQRAQIFGSISSTSNHGAGTKNHSNLEKAEIKQAPVENIERTLQPFYVKEYIRQSKLNAVGGSAKAAKPQISSTARGEEYLRQIDGRDPKTWPKEQRYAQIQPLLQMGLGITEIALMLGLGIGEVQLVSKLQKAN